MKHWLKFVVGMVVLLSTGPAFGQSSGRTSQVQSARSGNPAEMSQYVRSALEEMMNGLKAVSRLSDAARREGDDEMLRCVQVKLSNVRALMMVSERANGAMKEAQARSSGERAEHEFRKIVVSLAKVRQFVAEADACMGDVGTTPGTSEVQVDAAGLEEADEMEPMDDYFTVLGVDPPPTSPFE
jgi:hypothetical protein